jgi:hypothetical protein
MFLASQGSEMGEHLLRLRRRHGVATQAYPLDASAGGARMTRLSNRLRYINYRWPLAFVTACEALTLATILAAAFLVLPVARAIVAMIGG